MPHYENIARTLHFILVLTAVPALAHPGHDDNSPLPLAAAASPGTLVTWSSLPENRVTITVEGAYRFIRANGLPSHETGQSPGRGNPNRITAQSYSFCVPLNPQTNAMPRAAPVQRRVAAEKTPHG